MKLINTLIAKYENVSMFLAYFVTKGNAKEIHRLEREQHEAAVKLIVGLVDYHAVTVEEIDRDRNLEGAQ